MTRCISLFQGLCVGFCPLHYAFSNVASYFLAAEIVENVKNGGHPPFRPSTEEEGVGEEEVIAMMKKCWAEECMERPDFQQLKSIIRRLNK